MSPAFALGATGFGLIAVCYGFARFAFGLFLPSINADLALSSSLSGLISGGAFLGYCVAIILSAWLTERLSARIVAVGAALVAAVGMTGMTLAPSAPWLAAAVTLAGSSTGLASPPMAAAVSAAVRPEQQSATNTVINAGTGAGVVMSGPVALMMGDQWRLAFAGFAVAAVVLAMAAIFCVPNDSGRDGKVSGGLPALNDALKHLIAAAFLMGAASTALWSFGGQLVSLRLDWGSTGAGLLWIAIGAAGMAGAAAGSLVSRLGVDRVHRFFLLAMAAGIMMVGMGTTPTLALGGGVLFGLAYIMITGVYLVWGVSALAERPATGLMVGFLTIAIGQTAGAPVFGLLMDVLSPGGAVMIFAGLALVAGLPRAGRLTPAR